jgi:riboflavin kinase/FMN adenylyltransferase
VWITYSTAKALNPTAVALGNFDGVHRGHQRVIQPVLNFVRSQESGDIREQGRQGEKSYSLLTAPENAYPTVVTFNPHPQEFFSRQARALLTPLEEKAQQLSSWGIEQLVLLPFDRELAALSPQDFVEKILVQQLHTQMISVGEDFCFGKQRSGTATDLQAIASNFGIPVTIVPNFTCHGDRISSSAIRQALTEGDLRRAKLLLERPYIVTGIVVKGQQLGRTIGFPTANIQLPPNKFIPRQGVYAVRVFIEGERQSCLGAEGHFSRGDAIQNPSWKVWRDGNRHRQLSAKSKIQNSSSRPPLGFGVMNIGTRPTVNGLNQSVEVHILDWSGDLYGKTLIVQLEEFLRPEQKFASLEELKAQINADCAKAKLLLREQSGDYQQVL